MTTSMYFIPLNFTFEMIHGINYDVCFTTIKHTDGVNSLNGMSGFTGERRDD